MNRRALLKFAVGMPLAFAAGRLLAVSPTRPKLLLVFLRGGYDAASVLVPIESEFYYLARPNIAVARPSADASASIVLDSDWGLHPSLRDTIYPLFQKNQ